jgi:hypothetical protein
MSDQALEPGAQDEPGDAQDAQAPEDSFWNLLDHLRIKVLEQIWPDKSAIRSLLKDARVNLNNYPLSGETPRTLWCGLLPSLDAQRDLAKVLRVVRRDVENFQDVVDALLGLLKRREHENAAAEEALRLTAALEAVWKLLSQGSAHQVTLLQTAHPTKSRIAGIRDWVQDCVNAVHAAQETSAKARPGMRAQLDDIAARLGQVVDDFQMYASILTRFQQADLHIVGESAQSRALSAIAEDERLLISCRSALRISIAELTAVPHEDQ